MAEFFTFPLANLVQQVESISVAIRTLPDTQFAAERDILRERARHGDPSVGLMSILYDREERRRRPEIEPVMTTEEWLRARKAGA